MKLLPVLACLALLLPGACARDARPRGTLPSVRCELVRLEPTTDTHATATFRATNEGPAAFHYLGHSPDGPIYQCEVLEGGAWQSSPLGWCGTGLGEQKLAPGVSMEFATIVPRDGRRYRFELGEPAVRTPEVSAAPGAGASAGVSER
jgi:hypothetical protein